MGIIGLPAADVLKNGFGTTMLYGKQKKYASHATWGHVPAFATHLQREGNFRHVQLQSVALGLFISVKAASEPKKHSFANPGPNQPRNRHFFAPPYFQKSVHVPPREAHCRNPSGPGWSKPLLQRNGERVKL